MCSIDATVEMNHGGLVLGLYSDMSTTLVTTAVGMREIPDHATFREKMKTLGWLDKLDGFLYENGNEIYGILPFP